MKMNANVLARLLRLVKLEADAAQHYVARASFPLETAREIEEALEQALATEMAAEDEERFAKENAAIVETRLEGVEEAVTDELSSAVAKVLAACERLREAVNP